MTHNYYQSHGGEDESFHAEATLLKQGGQEVVTFTRSNTDIIERGLRNKIDLFTNTIWADNSYREIIRLIRGSQPKLAHFQNIFPLISPSVYYACKSEGIPVVQTLRNYRLICSNGFFLRDGKVCEDCMGKFIPWPGIVHACYRNSVLQTAAVASMLTFHRFRETWSAQVDIYITLTDFSRRKLIESGMNPNQIMVKPNYVLDPGIGNQSGSYVAYAGRLSEEKGIEVLLKSFKRLPKIGLKIMGDGPLRTLVKKHISENDKIKVDLMGYLPRDKGIDVMKQSRFLVFPSIWYETFGRTIIEAFACGIPVIASRLGAMAELVHDGETGLLFTPGDADDLAEKINWLWHHPNEASRMGRTARIEYEEKFTPDHNYELLMAIYQKACAGN